MSDGDLVLELTNREACHLFLPVLPHALRPTKGMHEGFRCLTNVLVRSQPGEVTAIACDRHTAAAQRIRPENDLVPDGLDVLIDATAVAKAVRFVPKAARAAHHLARLTFPAGTWQPNSGAAGEGYPALSMFSGAGTGTPGALIESINPALMARFEAATVHNPDCAFVLADGDPTSRAAGNPTQVIAVACGPDFAAFLMPVRFEHDPPIPDWSWVPWQRPKETT